MITDAQKIAAFDALCQRMQGKRRTRARGDRKSLQYRQVPVYEWTISSSECDIAAALVGMIPPVEECRPWPRREREVRARTWDQGYGFLGGFM